jgi:hypothetical protein
MCDPARQEPSSGGSPGKGLQKMQAICATAARVVSALAGCVTVLAFLMR